MAEDEDTAIRLVNAYREEIELLVHQPNGRLVFIRLARFGPLHGLRFARYHLSMQLLPDEEALLATLDKLEDKAKSELAAAIGKARLDIAWFDEPQVVDDALAWIRSKIDASEADPEVELLELRSALRRVRTSLHP